MEKKLEFLRNGIPHLLKPVVTDVNESKAVLQWAEKEMDQRYQKFATVGARNITSFNEKIAQHSKEEMERRVGEDLQFKWEHMPYIVVVVDELADLMMVSSRDVEESITRLAQMARAAGIHLIIATQRPSVDVLTGII